MIKMDFKELFLKTMGASCMFASIYIFTFESYGKGIYLLLFGFMFMALDLSRTIIKEVKK